MAVPLGTSPCRLSCPQSGTLPARHCWQLPRTQSRIVNSLVVGRGGLDRLAGLRQKWGRPLPSQPQWAEPLPLHLQVPPKGSWGRLLVSVPGGWGSFQQSWKPPSGNTESCSSSHFLFIPVFLLSFNIFLPITNFSLQTLLVEILESTEKLKKKLEITHNPTAQR